MPVPPLFAALVDDAGLFPPARLSMPTAVARHRCDVAAGHPVLTHRFLCPASQLGALRSQLGDAEVVRVGLIADADPAALRAAVAGILTVPQLQLETVEFALSGDATVGAVGVCAGVSSEVDARVFVEIPRTPGWRDALALVADEGLGAKVRCGGAQAVLFPTRAELAKFVCAAVSLGVPFKATAGLHHAMPYRDHATGFDHHGFVNLLLAVCWAVQHAAAVDVEAALGITDAAALVRETHAVAERDMARARNALVAYGSCSTSDPIADLSALALI